MEAKYELTVDYGKPYSEFHKTLGSLRQALLKLDKFYENNSHKFAYFDVNIYQGNKDITEEIFRKFKLGFYKEG